MTKKDYELIAKVIKTNLAQGYVGNRRVEDLTHDLADALKEDNPSFQRGTFLDACGVSV